MARSSAHSVILLGGEEEVVTGGAWIIDGNMATWSVTGTGNQTATWIDASASDVDVDVVITLGSTSACAGLCFRVQDADSYLVFYYDHTAGRFHLAKLVDGTLTDLDTYDSTQTLGTSHTFKVTAHGTALVGYLDGNPVCDVTDATFLTQTRHGLFADGSIDDHSTWNDFTITMDGARGVALDATVRTSFDVDAHAECASAIGSASNASVAIQMHSGVGAGVGAAFDASAQVSGEPLLAHAEVSLGAGVVDHTGGGVAVMVRKVTRS